MLTWTDTDLNVNRLEQSVCELDTTHLRTDSRAAHNKGLPKAGVTNFYDTFVLNQTLVFQLNGSAEIPRLRQAPNRYLQTKIAGVTIKSFFDNLLEELQYQFIILYW